MAACWTGLTVRWPGRRSFTDVMRSEYDETARLVNELIEAGIQ
ncbi:MAG: hypothetical protein OXL98_04265 [Acidimicrobiaceae bacterium]|nr:hypothetical protein [Acidimicrobiaceae bacterium]